MTTPRSLWSLRLTLAPYPAQVHFPDITWNSISGHNTQRQMQKLQCSRKISCKISTPTPCKFISQAAFMCNLWWNSNAQALRGPDGSNEEAYQQAWSLVAASQSPELWGWEVGQGRDKSYRERQWGWGGGQDFEAPIQNTLISRQLFWWSRIEVWVSEGGWDRRRLGVGVASISKPHHCGSAESSLQVLSQQTQLHVPEAVLGSKWWGKRSGRAVSDFTAYTSPLCSESEAGLYTVGFSDKAHH